MVRTVFLAFVSSVCLAAPGSAQTPQPGVKAPDTVAGKALSGWIESFNAGGEARKSFLRDNTTLDPTQATEIFEMDEAVLKEYGPVTLAKIVKETPTTLLVLIRHATTGAHGKLSLDVESAAPHRIVDMQLQGASPDDIKGAD